MAAVVHSTTMTHNHAKLHPLFVRSSSERSAHDVRQEKTAGRRRKGTSAKGKLEGDANTTTTATTNAGANKMSELPSSPSTAQTRLEDDQTCLPLNPSPRKRKRRRIEASHTSSPTVTVSEPLRGSSIKAVVPSQRPNFVQPSEVSGNGVNVRVAQDPGSTSDNKARESSPARKPLCLNAQGGLGPVEISRSVDRNPLHVPKKRRRRKHTQTRCLVVILRYGTLDASRRHDVGGKIAHILSQESPTRGEVVKEVATLSSAVNPSKPTHPFFVGTSNTSTATSNSVTKEDQVTRKVAEHSPPRRSFITPIKPRQRLRGFIPEVVDDRFAVVESDYPLPRKRSQPGAPWPWKGLTHEGAENSRSRCTNPIIRKRRPRRQKEVNLNNDAIFSQGPIEPWCGGLTQSMSFKTCSDTADSHLMVPIRTIETARSLKEKAQKVLAPASDRCALGVSNHGENISSFDSHAALATTFQRIGNNLSHFDQGTCENSTWLQKYAPKASEQVLQPSSEMRVLRDWLAGLTVDAVEKRLQRKAGSRTASPQRDLDRRKRKKRKKRQQEGLDGFLVSSDEENDAMYEFGETDVAGNLDKSVSMSGSVIRSGDVGIKDGDPRKVMNAILLAGPSGCGKTAAAHAVAQEMGFSVFEINPSTRRSGKDILDRVGDMALNHQVSNTELESLKSEPELPDEPETGQNMLTSFFKTAAKKSNVKRASNTSKRMDTTPVPKKSTRSQKQSLILLEEVDVLFEDDKQFWETIVDLAKHSRRPIIMTCNNETTLPLETLSLHAILRLRAPPTDLATTYLCLIAACEGHMLRSADVTELYKSSHNDLRASIAQLNFWCQMAVGSEQGGLDWCLRRWPIGRDLNFAGEQLHVVSNGTYRADFSLPSARQGLHQEDHAMMDAWEGWGVDPIKITESALKDIPVRYDSLSSGVSRKDQATCLQDYEICLETLSALDTWQAFEHPFTDANVLDLSLPSLQESSLANYTQDFPVVHAEEQPDYSSLSAHMYAAVCLCLRRNHADATRHSNSGSENNLRSLAAALKARALQQKTPSVSIAEFATAFDSFSDTLVDWLHPSSSLVKDVGPYVRTIAAYDQCLERHRVTLAHVLDGFQGDSPSKKSRTTRASRSALEGSQRANTRRERWFDKEADYPAILATAGHSWPRVEPNLIQRQRLQLPDTDTDSDCASRPRLSQSSEGD